MPKNLEAIKEKIIEEAKRQVFENGYAGTTIRTIASGCGIAVGTIYNYFESKDYLIATFLMEDWKNSMITIKAKCDNATTLVEAARGMYEELIAYEEKYAIIFKDPAAVKDASGFFTMRHKNLRAVLAQMLGDVITRLELEAPAATSQAANSQPTVSQQPYSEFLPTFLAENILTWSNEGVEFEIVSSVFEKLV